MNIEKATKKDLYYTDEHGWIDFQGTIAYVGVCNFKLPCFTTGNKNLLLQQGGGSGGIVLINPTQPYERKGLLLPKEYQLNGKGKHAKS